MRPHYEAFGRVCAAAIANGDNITMSRNEMVSNNGEVSVSINHNGFPIFISAKPTTGYLTAAAHHQFQGRDGFDVDRLPHVSEAEEILSNDEDVFGFDGSVYTLTVEDGQVDLFDGIGVRRPLYAYEDQFGLEEYRQTVSDIVSRSRNIFQTVSRELDIEMDVEDSASENQPSPSQTRSFQ